MKRLLILSAFALLALPVQATIYYIDYVGGADTNNGTSTSTPWKRAPGMVGCANTCASTTPAAGDSFIFKGGVTWPNAVFTWAWTWNGTAANRIYIGRDVTWYTGGSWARPILDSGGTAAGTNNVMFDLQADYVTFDNFEVKGLGIILPHVYGKNIALKWNVSIYPITSNCYFHGWAEVANTVDADVLVMLAPAIQNPPLNTGGIIEYNTFDGFDTALAQADLNCTGACDGSGQAIFGAFPVLRFNTFRNLPNGAVGSAGQMYGNLFEKIRNSTATDQHENAFESNGDISGALIYNNTIHTVKAGVTFWVNPQVGNTTKVFNNLIYDTTAGNVFNVGSDNVGDPRGSIEIYNNTIECGPDANPTNVCITLGAAGHQLLAATVKNNHLITSNGAPISQINVGTYTASNNLTKTKAQATTDGYTPANAFIPTDVTDYTIGAGVNVTSACPLCAYDINGAAQGDPPDVGAYKFVPSGGGGSADTSYSPTNLTFAEMPVGHGTVTQTITLTNVGGANLTVSSVAASGTNAADFHVTSTCVSASPIAVSGTCTITIFFNPQAAGSRSGSVTITSDAASSPDVLILSGTAVTKSSIALVGMPQ